MFNFVKNYLERRQTRKLMGMVESAVASGEAQGRDFALRVKATDFYRDWGDYIDAVLYLDKTRGETKTAMTKVDTLTEALLLVNQLRRNMMFDGKQALHIEQRNTESLDIIVSDEKTGAPLLICAVLGSYIKKGEAAMAEEKAEILREELRFLREEADEDHFRELYVEQPYTLTADERSAALQNPRIAHLVPKEGK
ncbi:hypothetical protein VPZ60_004308 [Salmonella enterica]|nr:hypothetical protein [Salmonella enterica]